MDSESVNSKPSRSGSSKISRAFSNLTRRRSTWSTGLSTSSNSPSRESVGLEPERSKNEYGLVTLWEPTSGPVIADFIFIHGLGGGSFTTWCKGNDTSTFWPKAWLPQDESFRGARIHTFGYNADWATVMRNPLDVHAFGQSLIEEIANNPTMKNESTSIVLVGHSMGGLVMKRACILARHNPQFSHIARRFHSFFFLGTPHRGADMAKVLNNILKASFRPQRVVEGLVPGSELIRTLNDEFRVFCEDIRLHSFFEGLSIPGLGLIVSAESATLGYREERPQVLNAHHMNIVRFSSPSDSNYRSLRNRLASTMEEITSTAGQVATLEPGPQSVPPPPSSPARSSEDDVSLGVSEVSFDEQIEAIRIYLRIELLAEDSLSSLLEKKLRDSCSWITDKPQFEQWQTAPAPRYFWLKGAPACGKSFLASHVIDHLIHTHNPTCFHFFKAGNRLESGVSGFLRSMAWQMSKVNPQIREALHQLSQRGPSIDVRNTKAIWHSIYTTCVFRKKFSKTHYWVIDALDEAGDSANLETYFALLSKIEEDVPLKVFITSRPSQALENEFSMLPQPRTVEEVTIEDTLADIEKYVRAWSVKLPVTEGRRRQELVQTIVQRSQGCFLWVTLVMKQLSDAVTVEEIQRVLDDIPREMNVLYKQNMSRMVGSKFHVLAKHIITWALCVVNPLSLEQMTEAVKLSNKETLADDLKTRLPSVCGQFLGVDKQQRVHLVHETARAFLLSQENDSKMRFDLKEGHAMVVTAFLEHLVSNELRWQRGRRIGLASGPRKTSMADYICLRWSEHLSRCSSRNDNVFRLLEKLFRTHVLSWIECVAQLGDLDCLMRTSRHLSNYLGRRSKHYPLVPGPLHSWVTDLRRIVTQFGVNLLNKPDVINTLVAPFCPRESAIYQSFGYAEDGIKLLGSWDAGWDDRTCSMSYHDVDPTAIASVDERFAVGLSDNANSTVKIYNASTCEEVSSFLHGEYVRVVEFGATSTIIAAAGLRRVNVWDVSSGTSLLEILVDQTLAMAFNEKQTQLIVASRSKVLSVYDIRTKALVHRCPWTDRSVDPKANISAPTPTSARISVEHQMMAVVYRGIPVQIVSLETQRPVGPCIRGGGKKHGDSGHMISCVAFSPSVNVTKLAVSYWDGEVTIFDIPTCKPLISLLAEVSQIAVSPNGKTLVGGDDRGAVRIFDLDTLQLLQRVPSSNSAIKCLALTGDSLRVVSIGGKQLNVLEPAALVTQDNDLTGSEPSGSLYQTRKLEPEDFSDNVVTITCLHCCEESSIAFCGRSNGWVDTCDLDNPGKTTRQLYQHRGSFTSVTCIDWLFSARVAVSADSAGKFYVMQIQTGPRREWSATPLLEDRLEGGASITQVLLHPDGTKVLVSSNRSDSLWCVSSKRRIARIQGGDRKSWKWFRHSDAHLVNFEDNDLKIFSWASLKQVALSDASAPPAVPELLPTVSAVEPEVSTTGRLTDTDAISITSDFEDLVYIQRMPLSQASLQIIAPTQKITKICMLDLSRMQFAPLVNLGPRSHSFPTATSPTTALAFRRPRSPRRNVASIPDVDCIIGTGKRFKQSFLVFISRQGWVCSIELSSTVVDSYRRHFFIPTVWRASNPIFITKMRRNQDVIFVHREGVIVVKNGFDVGEDVSF